MYFWWRVGAGPWPPRPGGAVVWVRLLSEGTQREAEAVSGSTAAQRLDWPRDQLGFIGEARSLDIPQAVQEAAGVAPEFLPAFATAAGFEATVTTPTLKTGSSASMPENSMSLHLRLPVGPRGPGRLISVPI